jgi:hypothetical protein
MLADEMKRAEAGRKLVALDTARYALAVPGDGATEAEWKAALDNARTQLEHQRIRCVGWLVGGHADWDGMVRRHNNLALLGQYGANAWRVHNYMVEAETKKAERMVAELKEETTVINRERKNTQVSERGVV